MTNKEKCPECGDYDVVTMDWVLDDEPFSKKMWVLQAQNINIQISFCPFCGCELTDGMIFGEEPANE